MPKLIKYMLFKQNRYY